jgi:hypothetical protein
MQPSKIERRTQWNLIQIAEAWCTVTGGNLSSAGRQAVGDSRFFTKLIERYAAGEREPGDREGSITTRVYDETISWFCDRKNWPDSKVRLPDIDDPFNPKRHAKHSYSDKTASNRSGKEPLFHGSSVQAIAHLRKICKQ